MVDRRERWMVPWVGHVGRVWKSQNESFAKPSKKEDAELSSDSEDSGSVDGNFITEEVVALVPRRTVPSRASRNRKVSYDEEIQDESEDKDASDSDSVTADEESEEDYKPASVLSKPNRTSVGKRSTVMDLEVPPSKNGDTGPKQTGAK
jgi:hypothetical protein